MTYSMLSGSPTSLRKLFLFLSLLHLYVPHSDASDGEKRLYADLFGNDKYNKEIRPRHDPTQSVIVDLELDLNHLMKLDEQAEVMRSSVIVDAEWDDDYLKWKPDDYDNVEQIVLSPYQVWIPDLGIQNSATNFYPEDYFDLFRLHVHHTGRVRWWFGGVVDTSCNIDGRRFPFDHQECSIVVQSWAYSEAFVDLRNHSNYVHLDGYNDDAIWHLVATSVKKYDMVFSLEPNVSYAQIEYTLYLDRKPLHYFVNVILPCALLVIISLLVYWLPPESDEKISLSMTVLLAFSVFLFVVNEFTPDSSDRTPIMGMFVTVSIFLSTASVVTSIFVVRMNYVSKSPVPPTVKLIAFRYLARVLRVTVSTTSNFSASPDELSVDGHSNSTSAEHSNANCSTQSAADCPKVTENGKISQLKPEVSSQDDSAGGQSNATFAGDANATVADHSKEESAKSTRDCPTKSIENGCLCQLQPEVTSLLHELRKITRRQETIDHEAQTAEEWRCVALVLDRLLFAISLFLLICISIWMIAMSAKHPDVGDAVPAVF